MVEGAVVRRFRSDKSGVAQFRESLLETEVRGVSFIQYKFGNLRCGKGKIHLVKHV